LFFAAAVFMYKLGAVEDIQMFSNRSKRKRIMHCDLANAHIFSVTFLRISRLVGSLNDPKTESRVFVVQPSG
jgi:hypothetical protein